MRAPAAPIEIVNLKGERVAFLPAASHGRIQGLQTGAYLYLLTK
jgi:hypothetical protein